MMRATLKREINAGLVSDVVVAVMESETKLNAAERKFLSRFEEVLEEIEGCRANIVRFGKMAEEIVDYDLTRAPSKYGELQKAQELDMDLGRLYAKLELLQDFAPVVLREQLFCRFFETK